MAQTKIGFIQASWHDNIVDRLHDSFATRIAELLDEPPQIDVWRVPGSLEIPLQISLLHDHGNYDIFVAAGLIVNGGIYRHEFVADNVLRSVMALQMAKQIPIIYAVLTPLNFHGSYSEGEGSPHENFMLEHFVTKGVEAANACKMTLDNVAQAKALKNSPTGIGFQPPT
jgi:6,7-dimethyl-8-ribityllumazine synthase